MKHSGRPLRNLILLLGLAAIVAALSAVPAAAQGAPVDPPLAASGNVHAVAHIPGSAAGMNFKGHYAYVTGWTGVSVLDIAKADEPKLVGELPLPHFENEDVDLCGNTLIVVNDREARDLGSVMYVVSIANPTAPVVQAVLPLGNTGASGRGSGHIANFVKPDCSQLWVDGGDHVEVVDLTLPGAPRSLGKFESAASKSDAFRVSHDTELDSTGTVWNVGGGGAAGYRLTDDPLAPKLLGTTGDAGAQSLALQRLHPPQLTAAGEDTAGDRGGLHRPGRGAAGRLPRPGEVRDLGRIGTRRTARSSRGGPGRPS